MIEISEFCGKTYSLKDRKDYPFLAKKLRTTCETCRADLTDKPIHVVENVDYSYRRSTDDSFGEGETLYERSEHTKCSDCYKKHLLEIIKEAKKRLKELPKE